MTKSVSPPFVQRIGQRHPLFMQNSRNETRIQAETESDSWRGSSQTWQLRGGMLPGAAGGPPGPTLDA